ncbi:MAG: Rne/Rng family ribonuclease [Varibaculum sp.]|nr:Rne/Rng family ribonuclease [Varibaculum sp.]
MEAKKQRRREGRKEGKRRHLVTEAEYLARRDSVKREMLIREQDGLNQIAVLEDGLLVEHYVARHTQTTMVGSVYLGRVQNVLPSMEAAFVDLGRGRNAVLYAGEVNWDAAGLQGRPRRIESALSPGDAVMVQVTKDPIGHKGARLTAQITLAGRYLVLVPEGAMTGISRKLPEEERRRLKKLLKEIVPAEHGVIIRTAAEGASKEQLAADIDRLVAQWQDITAKSKNTKSAPVLLHADPELALRVVRDVFNEDFTSLQIAGKGTYKKVNDYVREFAPDLLDRVSKWTENEDIFAAHRIDEQLAKGMDRKVWLPSGGYLIIDRTEAMTVVDVNTGKYTGTGSATLEETVTKNNLEAAEEIVRQLRLRDIGGIIVIDFVDMVLESNRELVLRRLVECLGRDRTRHQVTEVTSLGLVQMTRKRVGEGLVEAFSTPCEACEGRGFIVHHTPVELSGGEVESKPKQKSKRVRKTDKETRSSMAKVAQAAHDAAHDAPQETDQRDEQSVDDKTEQPDSTVPLQTHYQVPQGSDASDLEPEVSKPKRARRMMVTAGRVDTAETKTVVVLPQEG